MSVHNGYKIRRLGARPRIGVVFNIQSICSSPICYRSVITSRVILFTKAVSIGLQVYNYDWTVIRPRYDQSTTYVTIVWRYRNVLIIMIVITTFTRSFSHQSLWLGYSLDLPLCGLPYWGLNKQAVGRRPPRYASASASWQYIRIYSPCGTYSGISWLFQTSATSWPFDLETSVRVTCDVGYLYANFSLPRPLFSS